MIKNIYLYIYIIYIYTVNTLELDVGDNCIATWMHLMTMNYIHLKTVKLLMHILPQLKHSFKNIQPVTSEYLKCG